MGLDFVRQNAFTKPHGDRDNARNILIVVTDGQSTRPDLTRVSLVIDLLFDESVSCVRNRNCENYLCENNEMLL